MDTTIISTIGTDVCDKCHQPVKTINGRYACKTCGHCGG